LQIIQVLSSSTNLSKELINKDLKFLCNWLQANSISLNAKKTELLIFHHPNKALNFNLNIKLNGKKLFPSDYVKYLGILIDKHLLYRQHMNSVSNKLARAIGMLKKIRHYVSATILRSIYFSIFFSLISYAITIWGQNSNCQFRRVVSLQNKAIKIINFANHRESPLASYKASKILRIEDYIKLQNFLYAFDNINNILPETLCNTFTFLSHSHSYPTKSSNNFNISLPMIRTSTYGLKSITFQSGTEWNFFMNQFDQLQNACRGKCKAKIIEHFLDSY